MRPAVPAPPGKPGKIGVPTPPLPTPPSLSTTWNADTLFAAVMTTVQVLAASGVQPVKPLKTEDGPATGAPSLRWPEGNRRQPNGTWPPSRFFAILLNQAGRLTRIYIPHTLPRGPRGFHESGTRGIAHPHRRATPIRFAVTASSEERDVTTARRRFLSRVGRGIATGVAAALVDAPNVVAQPKIQWRMPTTWV